MLRRKVAMLEAGLESNRLTGAAVGLLMARYRFDRAAAFAMLVRLSQQSNTKLIEVARAIVDDVERELPRRAGRAS